MSLWWMQGVGVTAAGDVERNAPSLWSGGVTWDGDPPTAGYWQTSTGPTPRTGTPDISIAVGGVWVPNLIRRASWSLGREQWLSTLQPSSASLEFEGRVTFDVMEEVVIGVMSDTTDEHSASLWVGYVDTITENVEVSGRITTSVSCTDVVGRLGQARAPSGTRQGNLKEVVEYIATQADVPLQVIDTGVGNGYPIIGSRQDGETALGFINRSEQAVNAILVLNGAGRLIAKHRLATPLAELGSVTDLTAPYHAKDGFDRTATDSWGTADRGGTWSPSSDADLDVADGWGTIVSNGQGVGIAVSHDDVAASMRCRLSALPASSVAALRFRLRWDGASTLYQAGVVISDTGVISYQLVDDSGTSTIVALPALGTYVPLDVLRVEAEAVGSTISVRVWRDGDPRPRLASGSITDTTLTTGSSFGLGSNNAAGAPTWSVANLGAWDAGWDEDTGLVDWSVQRSPTNVVNWWGTRSEQDDSTAARASRRLYGQRTFEPDESLSALDAWSDLVFSDVMTPIRPLLVNASFVVTDLGQVGLFLDPLDWVTIDGDDWQVMSVQHEVEPGHRWHVSITADQTQVGLFGLYGV